MFFFVHLHDQYHDIIPLLIEQPYRFLKDSLQHQNDTAYDKVQSPHPPHERMSDMRLVSNLDQRQLENQEIHWVSLQSIDTVLDAPETQEYSHKARRVTFQAL